MVPVSGSWCPRTHHLDFVLGQKDPDEKMYDLELPGHDKYDLGRTKHWVPIIPPHEDLDREVESCEDSREISFENNTSNESHGELNPNYDAMRF